MPFLRKKGLKVVLGISGGIDSSVAGLILKKQGFDVKGVFMRNWDITDETGNCSADEDLKDAEKACSILDIPLVEVNFSKDYWNYVFTYMIEKYNSGQTPNPDVLCNRHIKFNKFVKYAIDKFQADAVATGHYAQTSFGQFMEYSNDQKGVHLLKAVDSFKDQTFFLNQIQQESLQRTIFPLGSLFKNQVKKIAVDNNLNHLLKKKESTGICFIGKRNFSQFISEYLPDNKGLFVDIDSGRNVGSHNGIHHWTIGQRCRIGGFPDRLYIARKNPKTQEILVALGSNHKALWSQNLTTSKCHWIYSIPEILKRGGVLRCDFRFQHTQPLLSCRVKLSDNGSLFINLDHPLFALTPGQFAVLYKDNECLGGAEIVSTVPSLYSLLAFNNYSKYNKVF